ncbi:uracil-DNA glycosylase [Quadrisphaera granulorum]|uniref:uracil-DNA glycosylase n=1 Tax=Quadrisphaera granulorum TaxID=317664 RepID=UPI001FE37F30|nr:uracil-DNA glycosylase [Quadrisphaera granulorum]
MEPGSGWPEEPADASTRVVRTPAGVVRAAATSRTLTQLDARVSVCRACPRLVAWREEVAATGRRAYADQPYWGRPIAGWGDAHAPLLVVGLAPAAHGGNRTGRVFTGDRSGDWIFAALHRAGLAAQERSDHAGDGQRLDGVRIAAAVRCAPPDNLPSGQERAACAPWLDAEVQLVRPRVLFALGGIAWDASLACARRLGWNVPRPAPRFGHGAHAVLTLPQEDDDDGERGRRRGGAVHLVGSYHVSQQNTSTGRLTAAMLDEALGLAAQLAGVSTADAALG